MTKPLHFSTAAKTLAVVAGILISIPNFAQVDSTETTEELSFMEMIEFDDISDLSLEDLMNIQLKTGSFLELDLKNSPVSMTLITEGMLESSGARHLTEALEIYVPGFQYMYNKWNGAIWGMRGVAPDRNTKFIFLVNGHKMNHESRDGAMSELDLGMLGDIERIEVLRGPAGLVYGSGSLAGVVNVVTKTYDNDMIEVKTAARTWGSGNTGNQIEATVHKNITKDAKITVSAGYRQSDGAGTERSRVYGQGSWPYPGWIPSDDAPANGAPTAGSAWSTPGNYRTSVDFSYKNFRVYSRLTHQVTNGGSMFTVDPWPHIDGAPDSTAKDVIIDGNNVSYDDPFWSQTEAWSTNRRQYIYNNITTQLSYHKDIGVNTLTLNAGIDNASNSIVREDQKAYVGYGNNTQHKFSEETFGENRYSASAMYHIKSIDKMQLAAGYQFRMFDIGNDFKGNNSQAEVATHPIVSDVLYTNHALFAEGLYDISDRLHVNFGARYDAHTRTIAHGGVISPKLALIANASDKHTFKLIYQTSANNGSADNYEFNRNNYKDDGTVSTGDEYRYEDPTQPPGETPSILPPVSKDLLHQLKPERASSVEFSSVHEFIDGLIISPSVSYNTLKDLFLWNQELFRVQNGGKYNSINIDFEVKYSSEKLSVGFNHTFQQMINTNSNQQVSFETPVFEGYDSTITNGTTYYTPHDTGRDTTYNLYPIDVISADGKNFTSLATNLTKIYIDYSPNSWLTLHTNMRVIWGLPGRKGLYDSGFNDLGITKNAIIKWNIGAHVKPSENFKIGLIIYDVLGSTNNPIHSLRWQQYGTSDQTDLFSLDLRSVGLNMEYKF